MPKEPDADPILNRLRTFSSAAAHLPAAVAARRDHGARRQRLGRCRSGATRCSTGSSRTGSSPRGRPRRATARDYPLTQIRWTGDEAGKALTAASYLGTGNAVAGPARRDRRTPTCSIIVGDDWDDLVATGQAAARPERHDHDHRRHRPPRRATADDHDDRGAARHRAAPDSTAHRAGRPA